MFQSAIVIDSGASSTRLGFVGEISPSYLIPSDELGIRRVQGPSGESTLDIDSVENLWSQIYKKELSLNSKSTPTVLTEQIRTPKAETQKISELIFGTPSFPLHRCPEKFEVPKMAIGRQQVLAMNAYEATSGTLVDVGAESVSIIPFYDGLIMSNEITILSNFGGNAIRSRLGTLLKSKDPNDFVLQSLDNQTLQMLKEKYCFISQDPATEVSKNTKLSTMFGFSNGSKYSLDKERFMAPEILFNPSEADRNILNLSQAVALTIKKSNPNAQNNLFGNIYLAGGASLFPGFIERLHSELAKYAPKDVKINIHSFPQRRFASFIGASDWASQDSFDGWISKKEFEESGVDVVFKKRK